MSAFLTPVREVVARPNPETEPVATRYIKSYLWMRIGIGILGVLLPLVLVFGDQLAFHEDPFVRGSLSVYYFSGTRDEFVAILASTGIFLLTYKVAERNLDNAASLFAGFCAVLIALFPTGKPSYSATGLTRLQEWLGETSVKVVHIGASAGFLVALAVVSYFFGLREGQRPRRQGTHFSPKFWQWFHWICTIAMVLALVWIVVTMIAGWPYRSLLIGEWVSAWAFGLSWLTKGAEWDMLFGKPHPEVATGEPAAQPAPTETQPPVGVP
jgi:hypothetical protein